MAPPTEVETDVLVVVVTYNSAELLPGLFASFEAGLAGLRTSVVVVDNDSADGSPEEAQRLRPDATVVRTGRNAGYAAGLNIGVAAGPPSRAILVLNPDVRLEPGCAATLSELVADPRTGMAAPLLRTGDGALHPSIRREPTVLRALADAVIGARRAGRIGRLGEVVTDPRAYDAPRAVDWAEGSTLMVSRAAWDAVGPWDESFFLYSEETDFALRLGDAGYRVLFSPSATATHLTGGSSTSARLWPLLVANRWRLYRKRHGALASTAFWGALVLREASRAARGSATSRAALGALVSPSRMRERPGPDWLR